MRLLRLSKLGLGDCIKKLYKMWAFRRHLHYEIKVRIFSVSAALTFIIVFELVCLLSNLLHKIY